MYTLKKPLHQRETEGNGEPFVGWVVYDRITSLI